MTDYSCYLDLLDTQLWYFKNLMNRRNEHKDTAMVTSITKYWDGGDDRSPLELAYHAVNPLFQITEILNNPDLEWGVDGPEILETSSKSQEFLDLYEMIVTNARIALSNADISQFKGNMEEVGKDPALFVQRLKVFSMHLITHYGQAMKFHGMICHSMTAQE